MVSGAMSVLRTASPAMLPESTELFASSVPVTAFAASSAVPIVWLMISAAPTESAVSVGLGYVPVRSPPAGPVDGPGGPVSPCGPVAPGVALCAGGAGGSGIALRALRPRHALERRLVDVVAGKRVVGDDRSVDRVSLQVLLLDLTVLDVAGIDCVPTVQRDRGAAGGDEDRDQTEDVTAQECARTS
jgi:hypothetical protein